MKKNELITTIGRTFNKVGFTLKKHSPEILITAGVIGTVASTIMACKATTKVSEILEESKDTIDVIHTGMENGEINGVEYTEETGKKDLTIVYAKTGLKLVKLYAPAAVLCAASLTGIVASHTILRKRNVALAAAYATVDQGFKKYRGRVVDRFGAEIDREIKHGIVAKEIEETVVDENGEEKTVKTVEKVTDLDMGSDYARFFDESSPYWEKNPEYNMMFLRSQQNYANDLLKTKGRVFLNEVYEMLGIEKSKAGQVVGWVYDPDNGTGDNYIDFGIMDRAYRSKKTRDFINGYERVILLDFNVDGNVWESM